MFKLINIPFYMKLPNNKRYRENDHHHCIINTIITVSLYDANIIVGVETDCFHTLQ